MDFPQQQATCSARDPPPLELRAGRYGCLGPWEPEDNGCTSFSLRTFTAYRYSVKVNCKDPSLSSPWSRRALGLAGSISIQVCRFS